MTISRVSLLFQNHVDRLASLKKQLCKKPNLPQIPTLSFFWGGSSRPTRRKPLFQTHPCAASPDRAQPNPSGLPERDCSRLTLSCPLRDPTIKGDHLFGTSEHCQNFGSLSRRSPSIAKAFQSALTQAFNVSAACRKPPFDT